MTDHKNWCLTNFGMQCNCGIDGADSAHKATELRKLYRNVFSSAEGMRVLGNIAVRGRVFDIINPSDPIEAACRNVALDILQLSGVLDTLYSQLSISTKE